MSFLERTTRTTTMAKKKISPETRAALEGDEPR
jgi:hypothetical protein